MNVFRHFRQGRMTGAGRRAASLLCVVSLVCGTLATGAGAQSVTQKKASPRLSEDQRIAHVLNRLGFGARPGDVARVRAVGLERYIEQQLRPAKIDDAVVDAKLKNLPTLRMSTSELLAKYPNPGGLIRQLQRRGELPADLAAIRDLRAGQQNGAARQQPAPPSADGEAMKSGGESMMRDDNGVAPATATVSDADRREYRRAIRDYMQENGLQPPQRIVAELQASRILRAVYSERQLQEVMVDFWTNHFNVFAGKGADRWMLTAYDRDTIRPHTLGRFRDLLGATAQSPAMLFYLDNFQSVSPQRIGGASGGQRRRGMLGGILGANGRMGRRRALNNRDAMRDDANGAMGAPQQPSQAQPEQPRRMRRGINENYARELMELHTLGVDGGYTQKDVQEVARAFTGWTIRNPRGYLGGESSGTFDFNPRLHDDGEKVVLGHKIPAGGGMKDGEMVLDILARHPSTAKFIATKLARRFVADNPSPALVDAVAAAYTKSDGDIATTLRAVFNSPEFNSPEAYRAKIKTPFELVVSAIRTLGGETNASPALHQWIAKMGEPLYLYQAPTGYPDMAENWVNTGALLERLNFALALASNRIPGTRVDLARIAGDATTTTTGGGIVKQEELVERFLSVVLSGEVSPKTRAVLLKQLNDRNVAPSTASETTEMSAESNMRGGARRRMRLEARETAAAAVAGNPEVARIAALILGTPEFQRQ